MLIRYFEPQGGPAVPATIVKVAEIVPSLPTVIRAPVAVDTPVHETGTLWLTGDGRATVGCALSLLHSRMLPSAFGVQPDPVTVTTVPPFRQVPGATVKLGGPATVVFFGLHGTVVVVVAPAAVVVVVAAVVDVVVVAAVVVVVVLPGAVVVVVVDDVENVIGAGVAAVPSEVPNWMTHETPAVTWVGVGGQG